MNIVFGLMDQCDTKIDLIKYMLVNEIMVPAGDFCAPSGTCCSCI